MQYVLESYLLTYLLTYLLRRIVTFLFFFVRLINTLTYLLTYKTVVHSGSASLLWAHHEITLAAYMYSSTRFNEAEVAGGENTFSSKLYYVPACHLGS